MLGDFGMATHLAGDKYYGELKGNTPIYIPPEQMDSFFEEQEEQKSPSDKKKDEHREPSIVSIYSDIWNIGVIAFVMKFKEYPLMNEVMG